MGLGIAEIGHFTLTLAFGTALVMTIVPMIGAMRSHDDALGNRLMQTGRLAAGLMLAQIGLAFALLRSVISP